MGKIMHALLSAMLLVVLVACSRRDAPEEAPARQEGAADASIAAAGGAAAPPVPAIVEIAQDEVTGADNAVSPDQLTSSAATYVDKQRKFIRTANADFRVKDVYRSAIAIENVVAGLGGFVVSNQILSNV